MTKEILLFGLCGLILAGAFYIGMSRDLCRQNLHPLEYAQMKLDCSFWLYR